MQSGHVYKVDSVDSVDTQLWLSGDDVLICGNMMINKDSCVCGTVASTHYASLLKFRFHGQLDLLFFVEPVEGAVAGEPVLR